MCISKGKDSMSMYSNIIFDVSYKLKLDMTKMPKAI